MELRYVGPHDGVNIDLADGTRYVPRNGKLEVSGEVAEELLSRSDDWHRWSTTSEKTTTSTREG